MLCTWSDVLDDIKTFILLRIHKQMVPETESCVFLHFALIHRIHIFSSSLIPKNNEMSK